MDDALKRYDERIEKAKDAVVAAARDVEGLTWWQFRRRRVAKRSLHRALRELNRAKGAKQNYRYGIEVWDQINRQAPVWASLPKAPFMPRKEED